MLIGVISKNPVDGRTRDSKCGRDGARRLTAGVHPLRQSGFRHVACTQSRRYFCALAPEGVQQGLAQGRVM